MIPRARPVIWLLDALHPGGAERMALRFAGAASGGVGAAAWPQVVVLESPPGSPSAVRATLAAWWGESTIAALGERLEFAGFRGLADSASGLRLLARLRRLRPCLLHAHLRHATIWGAVSASWLRVPLVVTVHVGPAPPAMTATRRERVKAAIERWARRRAARVIYVSAAQRAAWHARWPRQAQHEHACVLGHGVETPAAAPAGEARCTLRRALGLDPDAFVCLTVAVVRPPKGWITWLDMVAEVAPFRPRAQFVWVGGGPDFAALAQAAGRHTAARHLVLAGPQRDVGPWLAASDLFVFPSREEAQPTAVLEAMAAGLPVVASDIATVAEVVANCGTLVPAGNTAALAGAVLDWSATSPAADARRARAGACGRRRLAQTYSATGWRRDLNQLYAEVIAHVPHHRPASNASGGVFPPRGSAAL